ncbi:MAG: hypothetical protein M1821_007417 [Bathelium mastoideum]|nr:MAG: hypothetical protein M1821_007417 [Bathelium mastoideum]
MPQEGQMAQSTSSYKPSPLSFNSPRRSPFQRSDSRPGSPLTVRASTPTGSPQKLTTPTISPEKRGASPNPWTSTRGTPGLEPATSPLHNPSAGGNAPELDLGSTSKTSPLRPMSSRPETGGAARPPQYGSPPKAQPTYNNADVLSHLPHAQLRSMRESFQVLDDKNAGSINSADVGAMLQQLGLDASPATLSTFFPPHSLDSMTLATYLNNLASLFAPLSSQEELLAAFAAFDDDDSGQVDLKELKDAVMHTAPGPGDRNIDDREFDGIVDGFKGRRAFGKGSAGGLSRGEVFKYRDFVAGIVGGANDGQQAMKS